MSTTTATIDEAKQEAFMNRAFEDLSAAYGAVMISLGDRLGLYRAMAGAGPLTSSELAERADCAERYVREWLGSQVTAGYVEYDAAAETYELPAEGAAILADPESPTLLAPAWNIPAAMWSDEDKAAHAFRTGEGVPWGDHADRLFGGMGDFYKNAYGASLVPIWLPAMDGVVERLEAGARVADVGCGHGHSTILMAQAFPNSRFHGYDTHAESIEAAREHAEEAGVADRIEFSTASATDYADLSYDLVCFFDAFHDMGDPVGVARHARETLGEGGTVMLVEPNAADDLVDNVHPIGRLFYSASTVLCTAHATSEGAEDALGAAAGAARFRDVFAEAGFGHWRKADESPFNLILEARV